MDEVLRLFNEVKTVLGGGAAIALAIVFYFHSRRAGDADKTAQLQAVESWKTFALQENDRRVLAEQRADQFAHERNEALQQLGELKGQLKQVLYELEQVRTELKIMKEQINGKH